MSVTNFSFTTLENLNKIEGQAYIKLFFFPLRSGMHAVLYDGKYELYTQADVKSTYFNRMPKHHSKWYFEEYSDLRSITYQINKPILYEDKLNLCPKYKHQVSPYNDFPTEVKQKVDFMLNYIFEILANKNKSYYEFIMKWLANMIQGNKNNSCLYLKGPQGIGKSTLFVFIRDYVIGNDLSVETGSEPIKSKFNGILAGKLLVMFEELETFSTNEWIAISSRLKRFITSNKMTIEKKGIDSYDVDNLNNYVILSNNDAVKDDDGRRYFILDLATHRQKDRVFWDNIYKNCFNDQVGEAFFSKLNEVDTTNFNPQDFPITQSKLDSFAKRLEHHELFLKDEFVLRKKAIAHTVDELLTKYQDYCTYNNYKALGKINFGSKLKELGIEYKKSDKVNKYKVPYATLEAIAKDRHWIHEIDDYKEDIKSSKSEPGFIDSTGLDYGLNDYEQIKTERDDLKQQLEQMRREMEELKAQQAKPKSGLLAKAFASSQVVQSSTKSNKLSNFEV